MKYPKEKKQEAKDLRMKEKLTYAEIATRVKVSIPTLKRWLKGVKFNGDTKVTKGTKVTKTTTNTGKADNTKDTKVSKSTDTIEVSENTSFSGINVTVDRKTGAILLMSDSEFSGLVPESTESDLKKGSVIESPSEVTIKPGLGQAGKPENVTRKPDIDEPENPIDSIFKRSTAEILIPLGLIVSGFLLSGKKGSKTEYKQENGSGDW